MVVEGCQLSLNWIYYQLKFIIIGIINWRKAKEYKNFLQKNWVSFSKISNLLEI